MPHEEFYQQLVSMFSERMDRIEKMQERMAEAIERQSAASEKVAVLLSKHEEHSDAISRAFDEMEGNRAECLDWHKDHETRLRIVEEEMPLLKITKQWVFGFSAVCLIAILTAAMSLLIG